MKKAGLLAKSPCHAPGPSRVTSVAIASAKARTLSTRARACAGFSEDASGVGRSRAQVTEQTTAITGSQGEARMTHLPDSAGRLEAELRDLTEAMMLHHIEHRDGGTVVPLGIPRKETAICDTLKRNGPHRRDHLGSTRNRALGRGSPIDREQQHPRGVVGIEGIVDDRPVTA